MILIFIFIIEIVQWLTLPTPPVVAHKIIFYRIQIYRDSDGGDTF